MAENMAAEIKMEIIEIEEVIYPSFVEEDSFEVHLTEDEKMENVEIKKEIQDVIFKSFPEADTYTVHKTEEDVGVMENIEIKEEIQDEIPISSTGEDTCTVHIKEEDEIPISSTVVDTCTVHIKEEDVKIEITDSQGKTLTYSFFVLNIIIFLLLL